MTTQLHDTGEEAIIRHFFTEDITKPASVSVGLYHDGEVSGDTTNGDNLSDGDDLGAITTELAGSNYSRLTYSFGTTDFTSQDNASADWEALLADKDFDVTDSTGTFDAMFVVINFLSNDTGDTAASNHLLFTGPLDQAYDASNLDVFTLSGSTLSLD